ncbi:MAG TPA: glycosyltransferase, partial [Sorangium sp.]|nr:glycosyltransferase [Sorangium sp.]
HAASRTGQIEWLGLLSPQRCRQLMAQARLLIFPSICYETFGLSIAEAFCAGTAVVATRGGAAEDHIEHGKNGWLCAPRDAQALATQIRRVWRTPSALAAAGRRARASYEERFGARRGYETLMEVYQQALQTAMNQ